MTYLEAQDRMLKLWPEHSQLMIEGVTSDNDPTRECWRFRTPVNMAAMLCGIDGNGHVICDHQDCIEREAALGKTFYPGSADEYTLTEKPDAKTQKTRYRLTVTSPQGRVFFMMFLFPFSVNPEEIIITAPSNVRLLMEKEK